MSAASTATLAQHLLSGNSVTMLRADADKLPEQLPDIDALFIDREGTDLSVDRTKQAVTTARQRNLLAVIRSDGLSDRELTLCARAAPDMVVLPQLRNSDELKSARKALAQSPTTSVVAQIETAEAVSNLEDLMQVQGITGYLIGPNDLADDMGYAGEPDHSLVEKAVRLVAAQLAAANKPFGLPVMTHAARTEWRHRGATLLFITLAAYLTLEQTRSVSPG